jgi:hypothetical protein
MEATIAPVAPTQLDFRAELHQLIDQIQDEAVLRAALLLLAPQVAPATIAEEAPELSSAWQQELDRRLDVATQQFAVGQGTPFAEVMARLQQETAA